VYGHCTGTFTALEIVRQLELRGRGVTALFVAAALPFHWAARLLPVSDLWQVVSDTRIHRMMKAWGAPKDEIDPATLHQMVGRFRRDARQAFGYGKAAARGTLATPLINIVSADDPLTKGHRDRYRRWQRHAEQVRLIVLGEGEHYFVGKLAGVVADIVVRIHRDRDAMIRQPNHVIDWQ
jgi:surfactin synthase thioesterase subunit